MTETPTTRLLLSPIPYCIEWDDSSLAARKLGWFFVYASDAGVEEIPR